MIQAPLLQLKFSVAAQYEFERVARGLDINITKTISAGLHHRDCPGFQFD